MKKHIPGDHETHYLCPLHYAQFVAGKRDSRCCGCSGGKECQYGEDYEAISQVPSGKDRG